jgi:hypothetical protein
VRDRGLVGDCVEECHRKREIPVVRSPIGLIPDPPLGVQHQPGCTERY